MAWLKLVRSGSDAELNNLFVTNAVTASNFKGDGSQITNLPAATTAATGVVEIATLTEVNTGTDANRVVTPYTVASSVYGSKTVSILVSDPNGSALSTGDGKAYLRLDSTLNGMTLVEVGASVTTASSSGIVTIQIRRVRSGASVDMLSTAITIDASEVDSLTATTPAAINTSNDDVQAGDQIHVDIDGAGTGTKGLCVTLTFRMI